MPDEQRRELPRHPSLGGPYFPYMASEAEEQRRERSVLPVCHSMAHERTMEYQRLREIESAPSGRWDAIVEAFYAGRESATREGGQPLAEAARRATVMSLQQRVGAAVSRAFANEFNHGNQG
jgi:hypothetical protein